MAAETLYGDDFRPGMEFAFGSVTLDEADIVEFARRWDPQAMHIDQAAAAAGPWGGLIASGIQTVGVYQRLVVDALWSRTAVKAGRALEAKLRRPVRPGATLTGKVVIREVSPRPQRGDAVVLVDAQLVDQNGEVVLDLTLDAVVLLRPQPPD
jgi:acyl dehydratase